MLPAKILFLIDLFFQNSFLKSHPVRLFIDLDIKEEKRIYPILLGVFGSFITHDADENDDVDDVAMINLVIQGLRFSGELAQVYDHQHCHYFCASSLSV